MNTLEKARAAGFVVLLDGRIGRETYHTVSGSLIALERFEAMCSGQHPPEPRGRGQCCCGVRSLEAGGPAPTVSPTWDAGEPAAANARNHDAQMDGATPT